MTDLAAGYHMSDLLIERAIEMDRMWAVTSCIILLLTTLVWLMQESKVSLLDS